MVNTQVFVKIENYKDVLHTVGLVKDKLADAKKTLEDIKHLKQKEDSEIEMWEGKLNEIESKIDGVDHILFEPSVM
jgi:predicted  nucleic acid-binding Zn-ribbon protein